MGRWGRRDSRGNREKYLKPRGPRNTIVFVSLVYNDRVHVRLLLLLLWRHYHDMILWWNPIRTKIRFPTNSLLTRYRHKQYDRIEEREVGGGCETVRDYDVKRVKLQKSRQPRPSRPQNISHITVTGVSTCSVQNIIYNILYYVYTIHAARRNVRLKMWVLLARNRAVQSVIIIYVRDNIPVGISRIKLTHVHKDVHSIILCTSCILN